MSQVLVIAPVEVANTLPSIEDSVLVPVTSPLAVVVSPKGRPLPPIVSPAPPAAEGADGMGAAIRERTAPCIEVRLASWDGESHSPISAACRGVISGFGVGGLARAAELLASE